MVARAKPPWFFTGRVVGGDRHHRHSRVALVAGDRGRPRSRPADDLPEQSQTIGHGAYELRERLQVLSDGGRIASLSGGPGHSLLLHCWSVLAHLLPYLELSNALNQLDLSQPLYEPADLQVTPANRAGAAQLIGLFLCPSDRQKPVSTLFGPTNYAACTGSVRRRNALRLRRRLLRQFGHPARRKSPTA